MWQVRFKETLLRPKAVLQCDPPIQTRLCTNRTTAATEAKQLMNGFTEAIARYISNWCEYSPFTAWSKCEPECLPAGAEGARAFRTRTRYVHQYPVPGLAPNCDADSLQVREACGGVPQCRSEPAESGGLQSSGDSSVETLATTPAVNIQLQSHEARLEGAAEGKGHFFSRARANHSFQAVISRHSATGSSLALLEDKAGRPVDTPTKGMVRRMLDSAANKTLLSRTPVSGEPTGQQAQLGSFLHADASATSQDATFSSPELDSGGAPKLDPHLPSVVLPQPSPIGDPDDPQFLSDPTDPRPDPTGSPTNDAGPLQGDPFGSFTVEDSSGKSDSSKPQEPSAPVQGDSTTIPFDSPTAEDSSGKSDSSKPQELTEDGVVPATQDAGTETPEPEVFLFGLSLGSFVACCLCGAFASATVVLLSVVCSTAVRSWLGYDWSGATDEERKKLLEKKGGLASSSATAPLVDPNGVKVLTPQGAPLVVSPCMGPSGTQYVTAGGSKIFVTMEGDFVDNWGKPVQTNELPPELQAKASFMRRLSRRAVEVAPSCRFLAPRRCVRLQLWPCI